VPIAPTIKTSNALKFGAVAGVIVLLIVGIWWWGSRRQVNEIQIQQRINEVRQHMKELDRQTLNLVNAVAEIDKLEQIEEFARQRDRLSHIAEGFSEQATKVGLESKFEQLQDRLKQVQIQLGKKEKELIAARKGRIFVETVPEDAQVRILNIKPKFVQGMELEPGSYLVEVAAEGYETQGQWIDLLAGHEEPVRFELEKIKVAESISPQKVITNSIGMMFVLIPAGKFVMGSPSDESERQTNEKQHEVNISKTFYLQTTEVSQGQWKKVMGNNPSRFNDCGDDCPVEQVSWTMAQEFIEKLNQMEDTNKYRLPTEAEWEYACRAGTTIEFSFGNDASELDEYG